ncbi:MAG: 2-hydroxychromene-2-carboxylate isomerase [Methylobacteriaceae bacterium]|nr:2-hydroxychromene-2-carboxylate isomerase [Methylobacteriaceae bacterium]
MGRRIDYFFSANSTWAYLGHAAFMALAARHGLDVAFRPVFLVALFAETGGLPLPKRHPVRQRYRLVEMQRWGEVRGLPIRLKPAHVPFDPSLADRVALTLAGDGPACDRYLREIFAGVWERDQNLADEATIAACVAAAGRDGAAALAQAKSEAIVARYAQNQRDAIGADVFGSPSYVLDGEVFWGQDRLDLLARALESGRAPYRPG